MCEAIENLPKDADNSQVWAAYAAKLERTWKEEDQQTQPPRPEQQRPYPELTEEQRAALLDEVGKYVAELRPAFDKFWSLPPQKPN